MNANHQRSILYYPTIKIENKNWLKQMVLYWDTVGTIVPHEAERSAYRVREFQELQDHGLLRFYRPEEYVSESEQLTEEFIRIRNSSRYQSLYRRQKDSPKKFDVYGSKIPPSLKQYIEENHLAEQKEYGVFALSRLDGLLFMSLLAKYLSDQDHRAFTTPGTDYRAYQELAFLAGRRENSIPVLALTLEQILPIPRTDVTLVHVLDFKRNRNFELLRFREVIDEIETELKTVTSPRELQGLIARHSEKITTQVELIDRLLTEANIDATYGTLDTLMGVDDPAVLGELIGAVTNPTPLNLIAKAVNGVIKVRKQRISAANEKRRTLADQNYTYLYKSYKEGIIDRP
jgi:hypothetical protein